MKWPFLCMNWADSVAERGNNDVVKGSFQQVEGAVFGHFHDFALARTFVVDAAEVEYAVDDDTVELFVERQSALLGV